MTPGPDLMWHRERAAPPAVGAVGRLRTRVPDCHLTEFTVVPSTWKSAAAPRSTVAGSALRRVSTSLAGAELP